MIISSLLDGATSDYDRLAGDTYDLSAPQMLIGRTTGTDIIITHPSISREHARVKRDPDSGRYTITVRGQWTQS